MNTEHQLKLTWPVCDLWVWNYNKSGAGAMTAAKNTVYWVVTWKLLFSCLVGEDKNLVVGGVLANFRLVGGPLSPCTPCREDPAIRYSGYMNVKYVEYGIRLWNITWAMAHAHLHTPLICFRHAKKAHLNI